MSDDTPFLLQWRGRHHGPWTYAEIRQRLLEGEIHSLYQIRLAGQWQPLREYIEQTEASQRQQRATEMAAHIRQKEAEQKTGVPKGLQGKWKGPITRPNPFANPQPVFVKAAAADSLHHADDSIPAPTCWLAVAAFVISCFCLVPYLNLVSWLPGVVLGHRALAQIQRAPALDGRWLAIAALLLSYGMLALAALSWLAFPDFFQRVFFVADPAS